jgi:predicted phosphodiesterase
MPDQRPGICELANPAVVLARLAAAGPDIARSGHTHLPHAGLAETAAGILFLQAGTAISTRLRNDANGFALVELHPGGLTLRSWAARHGEGFVEASSSRVLRTSEGWRPG